MAKKQPKKRVSRSRKSGLKKARMIQANQVVINKIEQAL